MPSLQNPTPPPLFTTQLDELAGSSESYLPLVPAGVRLESFPAAGHLLDYYPAGNRMVL